MSKKLALFFMGLACTTSAAWAAPFTATWVDTLSSPSTSPYVIGEPVVVEVTFDNGGNSTVSQTWGVDDLLSITYIFNNAPNTITTSFDLVANSPTMSGSFQTDGTGTLTAVPASLNGTATGGVGVTSDDPTGDQDFRWWINGYNEVLVNDTGGSISNAAFAANVETNLDAGAWSMGDVVVPEARPVPILSIWAIAVFALLLLVLGLHKSARGRRES